MKRLRPIASVVALLLAAPAGAPCADAGMQVQQLVTRAPDSRGKAGWSSLSRLSLTGDLDGRRAGMDWRVHLDWNIEALWGQAARDPLQAAAFAAPLPTWLDAEANLRRAGAIRARHFLYRGWLRIERDRWRLDIGRQRIAWGSGRFWNPTDRFNPVSPTALEPDRKTGVDAISAEWRYGMQGGVRLVHAPGRAARGVRAKSMLRWQDTFGEADIALMAGRIGAERVAGIDLTGNIGDATARLEWLQSAHGPAGGWGQAAAGLDGTLSNDAFPSGLYLAAEYFYNGAAGRAPRFPDRLTSAARHMAALMAGYDLTPLWRLEAAVILDPARGGWFAQPSLRWSVGDNQELRLLAQRAAGPPGSDFRAGGTVLFLRLDAWF